MSDKQPTPCYVVSESDLRANRGSNLVAMVQELQSHPGSEVLLLVTTHEIVRPRFFVSACFRVTYQPPVQIDKPIPVGLRHYFEEIKSPYLKQYPGRFILNHVPFSSVSPTEGEGEGETPREAFLNYVMNKDNNLL